jgi:S-adenosylmethionine decarboxylase
LNPLGSHLLVDLHECNSELLDDVAYIKQAMIDIAGEAGVTIVGESFHKFHPVGVTGVLSIAESHLLIHTWPEHGYAAFDIFTCGSVLKLKRAADLIIERLECSQPKYTELQRGLMAERAASAT